MTKRYIVWACAALTAGLVSAQQPSATGIRIHGRVTEAIDNRTIPIPFATIRLLGPDSLLLGGAVSDPEGRFVLKADRGGGELIVASCVGYETLGMLLPPTAATDTLRLRLLPAAEALAEVTVTAGRVLTKADRKVLLPTHEQRRTATDGTDLLRRMQLPRITVNPLDGTIGRTDGAVVRLCLNGVQVSPAELAAVRPEEVVRIEYHDAPGARYAGAGAVIDYITRRPAEGGGLAGDSFDAFGRGKWASIDHLSAQYHRGRSAWSLTAGYMGQRRDNWIRDYEETWHYPDRTVARHEVGSPVSIGGDGVQGHLGYSLADAGRYLFNARLSLERNYTPGLEEGDRHTQLFTSDSNRPVDIYEHTTERATSPSLDLYLQRSLGGSGQLILNVVGTYLHTDSRRIYRESLPDGPSAESLSAVCGAKYSLIAESVYERTSADSRLSLGVRHRQAWADNRYGPLPAVTVALRQAESAAFAEYHYSCGAWGATGSLTAHRLSFRQAGTHTAKCSLQPSLQLDARPFDRLSLRYGLSLHTQTPSLAMLSDVTQEIQSGMVRRGNPGLKPFRILSQQLSADYDTPRLLGISLVMGYRHEYRPVMECVLYEEGSFVRTYRNQRSFRRFSAEAAVTLRPWPGHLSLSVSPLLHRYISCGTDYRHTHTLRRLKVDADLTWGRWMLSYNTMMGPANTMYGEESLEERDMNLLLAGYKWQSWTVQVGVFNAFVPEYWMETRNGNALTPFVSRAHCRHSTYLAVKLGFGLHYGSQSGKPDRRTNRPDRESGIVQGTK